VTEPAAISDLLTAPRAICLDLTLFFFSAAATANAPPPSARKRAMAESVWAVVRRVRMGRA
jgi:hypothetical protein